MKLKIPYVLILFLLSVAAQCADDGSEDYDKAIRYLQSDECEKALEYVNKSTEKDPTNITYLELRGDILQREGKYPEAINSYDMALNLNCKLVDVRHKKCDLHFRVKEYDKTIACCGPLNKLPPIIKSQLS